MQLQLFEEHIVEDPRPQNIRAMHKAFGRTDGQACKTCANLVAVRYANTYYKCRLARQTAGPATDWRLKWPACGEWRRA